MVELSLKIVASKTRSSHGNPFAVENVDIVSCTKREPHAVCMIIIPSRNGAQKCRQWRSSKHDEVLEGQC